MQFMLYCSGYETYRLYSAKVYCTWSAYNCFMLMWLQAGPICKLISVGLMDNRVLLLEFLRKKGQYRKIRETYWAAFSVSGIFFWTGCNYFINNLILFL